MWALTAEFTKDGATIRFKKGSLLGKGQQALVGPHLRISFSLHFTVSHSPQLCISAHSAAAPHCSAPNIRTHIFKIMGKVLSSGEKLSYIFFSHVCLRVFFSSLRVCVCVCVHVCVHIYACECAYLCVFLLLHNTDVCANVMRMCVFV